MRACSRGAALLAVLAALPLTGCVFLIPDLIHHELDPLPAHGGRACALPESADDAQPFLGLALSGGGSRAAVYAAAGLEALWEHGLLDRLSHVSSVSGGSIAASWFMVHRNDCDAAEEADPCWADLFARFKRDMRQNFVLWFELRQLVFPIRWLSPTRRAKSFGEVVDGAFLHGATFGDLPGPGAGAPALFVNAASYDDGRRFVFSNRCIDEASGGLPPRIAATHGSTFSRDGCPRATPRDVPLSLAVAASAAFPGLFGPVAFAVPATCAGDGTEWWHLGDGGIIENTGVDTLEELSVRRFGRRGVSERASILSLDAGRAPQDEDLKAMQNYTLFTRDPGRVVGISKVRGDVYHDLVWDALVEDLARDGFDLARFRVRFDTAVVEQWPASCAAEQGRAESQGLTRPGDGIRQRFTVMPTSLSISDCDADLVERAAHAAVHQALNDGEAGRRLRASGYAVREVRH